jgi:hypothetical protein
MQLCVGCCVPSFQTLHTNQSKPGMKPLEACNPISHNVTLSHMFVEYMDGGSCHKHPSLFFITYFSWPQAKA